MSVSIRVCLVVLFAAPVAEAAARTARPMAVPDEDRGILANLAPPSDRATARGIYGDAVFARDRGPRRPMPRVGRRPCTAAPCDASASAFFRRNYVYTPSFVSAPQVLTPAPSGRTNLLSPITAFFLDPFGPRDPAEVR